MDHMLAMRIKIMTSVNEAMDAEIAKRRVEEGPSCSTCAHRGNNILLAIFDPSIQSCNRPNRKDHLFADIERSSPFSNSCGREAKFHSNKKA